MENLFDVLFIFKNYRIDAVITTSMSIFDGLDP